MKNNKFILITALLVFTYFAAKWTWGELAKAYFYHRCETDGGEFIYRTIENVEGLFQMRPREQRDYFDSLRKGELLEDPYGHTNTESQYPWDLFLPKPSDNAYSYFESIQGPDVKKYDFYKKIMTISERPIITGEPYWRYTYDGLRKEYKGKGYWYMHEAKQVSV